MVGGEGPLRCTKRSTVHERDFCIFQKKKKCFEVAKHKTHSPKTLQKKEFFPKKKTYTFLKKDKSTKKQIHPLNLSPPLFFSFPSGFFLGFFFPDLGGDAKKPPKKNFFFAGASRVSAYLHGKIFQNREDMSKKGL